MDCEFDTRPQSGSHLALSLTTGQTIKKNKEKEAWAALAWSTGQLSLPK